jgi:acyl carrier protein
MADELNLDELKSQLRSAFAARMGLRDIVDDDAGLFSTGLIDSLSVMDLVCAVEEEIGHAIPPAEITLENFDSLNRIARFAARLVSSGKG